MPTFLFNTSVVGAKPELAHDERPKARWIAMNGMDPGITLRPLRFWQAPVEYALLADQQILAEESICLEQAAVIGARARRAI